MKPDPVIDHDPNERKRKPLGWFFWCGFLGFPAFMWFAYLSTREPDWLSIGLGLLTGTTLVGVYTILSETR